MSENNKLTDSGIGIEMPDGRNSMLIDVINKIHEGITTNISDEELSWSFHNAMAYITTHFSVEEEMMKASGYPEFSEHMEKHKMLEKEINELRKCLEAGKSPYSVLLEADVYLQNWITDHILIDDKRFMPYMDKLKTG